MAKSKLALMADLDKTPCLGITIDGGSVYFGVTSDNYKYSHKIKHGFGTIGTVQTGFTYYTKQWSPTASGLTKFFEEVPTKKTRAIDIYLDTYNGSTYIGRDTKTLNVTLSEETGKPSISQYHLGWGTDIGRNYGHGAAGLDFFIKGKSVPNTSTSVQCKFGATKNKIEFAYGNKVCSSFVDLLGLIPATTTPKDYPIKIIATDSRGFSDTVTTNQPIAVYIAPLVNSFKVVRCDSDGNESDTGTYAKVKLNASWTSYDGKNEISVKFGYKISSDTSYNYVNATVTQNGIISINAMSFGSTSFSTDNEYDFIVILIDSFETTRETTTFEDERSILSVRTDSDTNSVDFDIKGRVNIYAPQNGSGTYPRVSEYSQISLDDVVAARTYFNIEAAYDSTKRQIHFAGNRLTTDGILEYVNSIARKVNDTTVYNAITLKLDKEGKRYVSVSESAPWRTALGVPATSDVVLAANVGNKKLWGDGSASIAKGGSVTVASLKNYFVYTMQLSGSGNYVIGYRVGTNIRLVGGWADGTDGGFWVYSGCATLSSAGKFTLTALSAGQPCTGGINHTYTIKYIYGVI